MTKKLILALDYDGTASEDIPFFCQFIQLAHKYGHRVVLVTMRTLEECEDIDPRIQQLPITAIATSRRAKKQFVDDLNIKIDIWIDDNPHFLFIDADGAAPRSNITSFIPTLDTMVFNVLDPAKIQSTFECPKCQAVGECTLDDCLGDVSVN